jgi:hypothetical protein
MRLEIPRRPHSSQSAEHDRFQPAFLSAEILRTYTRRNAVFRHDATSTASTTFGWGLVEGLRTEDRKLWGQEHWAGRRAQHPRFRLESSSPSQSEQPSPRQPSLAELILHIRERFRAEFAERLAKRLDYLAKISQEEYPEQGPIAPESLQDFVALLESTPNLAYPGVVLTPSGNIQVEWRKGKNRHFAVEFVGSGDVQFVVFAPDPKDSYKTIRASGMATVASLTDIVRPYDVESWATASTRRAA